MINAERHYTGERGKAYHEKKRGLPEIAIPWVSRLRAEKIQPHLTGSETVFEYGAGLGWNLLELRCARKTAYDISGRPAQATRGIEWVADSNQLQDEFADVVICHHVLEHVANPPEVLGEIRRVLRPGGKLLVYVPFEKERRYRRYDPAEPNHHLYSWNVQTLANLVAECAYSIQSAGVEQFGYDRFAATLAVKLRVGESGFRLLRGLAHLLKPASEVRLIAVRT